MRRILGLRSLLLYSACLFLMFYGVRSARSQSPAADAADVHYQAEDWDAAAAAYAARVREAPEDGQAWFRLGQSRHRVGDYAGAVAAWKEADALGFAPVYTRYNLACAHARLGEADAAFAWLDKAAETGALRPQLLEADEDLAALRGDPRFDAIVERMARATQPCRFDPRYQQFDFWVGTWDVFMPQGQQAGTNTIEKQLDGCLLLEHWTGAGGGAGKSMNFYDPALDKWVQVWVSARGNVTRYEGQLVDDAMRFEGQQRDADGTHRLYKMVFTPQPDGKVRQYIEESLDGGETWKVWFDGTYVPREVAEEQP